MTDNEKQSLINEFWDLEREAYQKRLGFLTAQVLPDCSFKTLKLEKLSQEEAILQEQFWGIMYTLISNFWEEVLKEII